MLVLNAPQNEELWGGGKGRMPNWESEAGMALIVLFWLVACSVILGTASGSLFWTQLMFIKYLFHFHLILTMSPQRKNYYVHFANRETETQRDKPNVSKPLCAKVTCPGFNSGTSRSQWSCSFHCIPAVSPGPLATKLSYGVCAMRVFFPSGPFSEGERGLRIMRYVSKKVYFSPSSVEV